MIEQHSLLKAMINKYKWEELKFFPFLIKMF